MFLSPHSGDLVAKMVRLCRNSSEPTESVSINKRLLLDNDR